MDVRQRGIVRQVAERLEHDADDRDPFLLRDVRCFVLREHCARLLFAVALGRVGEHLLHAVDKGVDRALGHVDLHIRPGVDEAVVRRLLRVNVRVGVDGEIRAQRERKAAKRAENARAETQRLLAHQKNGKEQHDKRERERREHGLCQLKRVVSHDAARRAQDAQVGGEHGIAAQLRFIVAAERKGKAWDRRGQICRPRAAEQEKAEIDQQHRHKEIQRQQQRQAEIGKKQIQVVQRRVGIGGEHQRDQPKPDAHERQPVVKPRAVRAAQPFGRFGVRTNDGKQRSHGEGKPLSVNKSKRIIQQYSIARGKRQYPLPSGA